jgi:hypothetical protein
MCHGRARVCPAVFQVRGLWRLIHYVAQNDSSKAWSLGDSPFLRLEHCGFVPTTGSLRSIFILHCLLTLPLLQESETNQRLMYRDVRQVQRLFQILLIL